ncbi:Protein of unknown function (DUF2971) [Sphaerochaeta pleomorpha str. Grapes]|uniref:DUF2971 domain-containing protein n=1 Tax=Sphaerochaeta pleomorpha (strain ATCC BAA-1885 / DSM 22778 / Grapes) TaxID=158190 RepID=G8QWR7_SPHPG|nr:DUF2971 domain-containing protein [Sphaerochaeta pleomorpha]AEV28361.1 Protein of unknown function (DUF2971) [Sphaerochaeta pleomorpha str. Grapes]
MLVQPLKDVPEIILSNDTIFHYTTAKAAVEFILFNEELKMSLIKNSKDPFEAKSANNPDYYSPLSLAYAYSENQRINIERAEKYINRIASQSKHVCFCENNYINGEIKSLNDCGFIKQRMWDQYGEHFSGVCLAFSLQELKKMSNKVYWKERQYLTYEEQIEISSIGLNKEKLANEEQLNKKELKGKVLEYLNRKNIDYGGEKEIRAITFTNSMKYLKIGNCLKSIIICADAMKNQFIINQIIDYAKKKEIEYFNLHWRDQYVLWAGEKERQIFSEISNTVKRDFF